ncbi:NifU family protein [Chloroflexota bacterium]
MKEKVEAALEKIRPGLRADGGDVELVDVQDGIATVRLTGACGSCPMSTMTLRMGVERVIKQEVPEIKELVAV